MEKTVQITIASTQFQVTESAYDTLRSYLDRLKSHFGVAPDGIEIMGDIESRIAEKFIDAKHRLITEKDVHAIIAEIGDASAISDDTESSFVKPATEPIGRKRLYRDLDNAYLGGVASGIAAYFSIDPLWIRLAFLISIFFGGSGVLLYLVLWLLIPEAKSASQKLEMSGRPVNLDTIAGVVKERFEEAEQSGAFARGARAINEVVRTIFGYIGTVIGALFTLASFFGIIATSVLLGIALMNWNAPWNDLPLKEAVSPFILKTALLLGFAAVIVPLVLIFSLGYRWMTRRTLLSATVGFGLVGMWALSLVGGGILAAKIGGDYYAYTSSSPEYAQVIDEHEVAAFQSINANGARITITGGDHYSVRIAGRKVDMRYASTTISNGVLTVTRQEHDEPCLFCDHGTPSVTVTVPALTTITARSSSVSFDQFASPSLTIDAQSSNISGTAAIDALTVTANSSWTGLKLVSHTITLDARNTRVELEGTADSLDISAHNASVDSEGLKTITTTVDAQNSSVHVRADATFNVVNDRGSDVQNAGTAAGVSETTVEN